MTKQCICPECGVVAEVRRQSNGKRLRYLYCVNGHGGLHTRGQAERWEKIEQDHIGELGKLPPESETAAPLASDSVDSATKVSNDWTPSAEDLPEVVEPEPKQVDDEKPNQPQTDNPTPTDNGSIVFKVGLGVLALFGFGGAAFWLNKRKGGS